MTINKGMLALPLDPGDLERILKSPEWGASEKCDGHRVVITTGDSVKVMNRAGQPRGHAIPQFMIDAFGQVPFAATFDGELVGTGNESVLWLFDLPVAAAGVAPDNEYRFRHKVLDQFVQSWSPTDRIKVVDLAVTEPEKRAVLAWAEQESREGIMFKRLDSRYASGARSPYWLKYKFRQDADVVVIDKGVGGKDNLVLGAYDPGGRLVEVGHCTALNGDGAAIKVGDVIMVNYVHFSKGGRLVQPTKPRLRKLRDKTATECTTDQFRRAHNK